MCGVEYIQRSVNKQSKGEKDNPYLLSFPIESEGNEPLTSKARFASFSTEYIE